MGIEPRRHDVRIVVGETSETEVVNARGYKLEDGMLNFYAGHIGYSKVVFAVPAINVAGVTVRD